MADHHYVGRIGEAVVARRLKHAGFSIVEQNVWKPWGEIDIVAEKDKTLHFIEVKSVVRRPNTGAFRPEENVHAGKRERLRRIITTYRREKGREGADFRIHLAAVFLALEDKKATIRWVKDISLVN